MLIFEYYFISRDSKNLLSQNEISLTFLDKNKEKKKVFSCDFMHVQVGENLRIFGLSQYFIIAIYYIIITMNNG